MFYFWLTHNLHCQRITVGLLYSTLVMLFMWHTFKTSNGLWFGFLSHQKNSLLILTLNEINCILMKSTGKLLLKADLKYLYFINKSLLKIILNDLVYSICHLLHSDSVWFVSMFALLCIMAFGKDLTTSYQQNMALKHAFVEKR